jgi:hypothetical protein
MKWLPTDHTGSYLCHLCHHLAESIVLYLFISYLCFLIDSLLTPHFLFIYYCYLQSTQCYLDIISSSMCQVKNPSHIRCNLCCYSYPLKYRQLFQLVMFYNTFYILSLIFRIHITVHICY